MTLHYGILPSNNGDRKYKAKFFAMFFASFIGNGVYPNPSNNLQVTEHTNMQTIVKIGKAWINGYFLYSDTDVVLTHDPADGVLKRIDRIVVQLNHLTREINILIKKGAYASIPVARTLQRDGDIYEIALADVLINNGALSITQANITDQRLNSNLCGIVHGVVNQVDTTTLAIQYQNAFQQMTMDQQQEFEQWFATLQDVLDGNVATNLQNQITQTKNNVITLNNALIQHLDKNASTAQKGHVQLSNDTNSTSETLAPTMKALNEVKQYANDIKSKWASVVGSPLVSTDTQAQLQSKTQVIKNTLASNLTAKGQSSAGTETLTSLVGKVANINTGKRFATGTQNSTTGTSPRLVVNGLNFRPRIISIYAVNNPDIFVYYASSATSGYYTGLINGSTATRYTLGENNTFVSDSGFTLQVPNANVSFVWEAIE